MNLESLVGSKFKIQMYSDNEGRKKKLSSYTLCGYAFEVEENSL